MLQYKALFTKHCLLKHIPYVLPSAILGITFKNEHQDTSHCIKPLQTHCSLVPTLSFHFSLQQEHKHQINTTAVISAVQDPQPTQLLQPWPVTHTPATNGALWEL